IHLGRSGETQDLLWYAGGFHHAAVRSEVAVQDREAAVGGVRVGEVTDASFGGVEVQCGPPVLGGERLGRTDATRRGVEELERRLARRAAADVPLGEPGVEGLRVHGVHVTAQQAGAVELAQDRRDATSAVHVLHVVRGRVRCHLAQARYAPGDGVDVGDVEVDLRLTGGGEQVQDGVGGAAHRHVEGDGVLEGGPGGDRPR